MFWQLFNTISSETETWLICGRMLLQRGNASFKLFFMSSFSKRTMKLKGDPLKFTVNITLDYMLDNL